MLSISLTPYSIKNTLMQLIFKANKNANQNKKYKSQHRKQRAPGSAPFYGSSEDPIDIECMRDSESSYPSTSSWQSNATSQTFSPIGSVMQPPPRQFASRIDTTATNREHVNGGDSNLPVDPYLVPPSREPTPQEVCHILRSRRQ